MDLYIHEPNQTGTSTTGFTDLILHSYKQKNSRNVSFYKQ